MTAARWHHGSSLAFAFALAACAPDANEIGTSVEAITQCPTRAARPTARSKR